MSKSAYMAFLPLVPTYRQQEQAILALLISYGAKGRDEYLDYARAAEAFYNIFFLNKDLEVGQCVIKPYDIHKRVDSKYRPRSDKRLVSTNANEHW